MILSLHVLGCHSMALLYAIEAARFNGRGQAGPTLADPIKAAIRALIQASGAGQDERGNQ